jgi:hypothetical protein
MAGVVENAVEDPKTMTVVQLAAGEAHTLALTGKVTTSPFSCIWG